MNSRLVVVLTESLAIQQERILTILKRFVLIYRP